MAAIMAKQGKLKKVLIESDILLLIHQVEESDAPTEAKAPYKPPASDARSGLMEEIKAGRQLKKTNSAHALDIAAAVTSEPNSLQSQILSTQLTEVQSFHKTVLFFIIAVLLFVLESPTGAQTTAPATTANCTRGCCSSQVRSRISQ